MKSIIPENNHFKIQTNKGINCSCQKIVLAGGAEISNLLFKSNLELKLPLIFAGRGVSLRAKSQIDFPYSIRTPNRGFACGIHLVPNNNSEIYIGATNRFTTTPNLERKCSMNELSSLIFGATNEINTGLNQAAIQESSIGYRPVTIDKVPIVGKTNNPNIYIASGTYRNGVLLAPLIAQQIREEILNNVNVNEFYDPSRKIKLPFYSNKTNWIDIVSKDLVQLIKDPNGFLPNNREEQIEKVFSVLLSSIFEDNKRTNKIKPHIAKLMDRAPIRENMPSLIELLSRIYR